MPGAEKSNQAMMASIIWQPESAQKGNLRTRNAVDCSAFGGFLLQKRGSHFCIAPILAKNSWAPSLRMAQCISWPTWISGAVPLRWSHGLSGWWFLVTLGELQRFGQQQLLVPFHRRGKQESVLTEEATLLAGLGEWPGEVLGHTGRAEHSVGGRGKVPCRGTCWSWELGQEGAGSSQKGSGAAALATFTVPTSGLGTGGGQIHPVTPWFRPAKAAGVESPLVPSQGDPGK